MGGIPEVGSPCGLAYLLSSSFSAPASPCISSHVRSSLRGSSRSMTRSTALLPKSAFVSTSSLRTWQPRRHTMQHEAVEATHEESTNGQTSPKKNGKLQFLEDTSEWVLPR